MKINIPDSMKLCQPDLTMVSLGIGKVTSNNQLQNIFGNKDTQLSLLPIQKQDKEGRT